MAAHRVFTWSSDDGLRQLTLSAWHLPVGRYSMTAYCPERYPRLLQNIKDKCISSKCFGYFLPKKYLCSRVKFWESIQGRGREECSPLCVWGTCPLGTLREVQKDVSFLSPFCTQILLASKENSSIASIVLLGDFKCISNSESLSHTKIAPLYNNIFSVFTTKSTSQWELVSRNCRDLDAYPDVSVLFLLPILSQKF